MINSTLTRLALTAVAAIVLLSGCGLAGTTAAVATDAATAAEDAKRAKELEAKVQRDIDAAQKKAAEVRDKAEAE